MSSKNELMGRLENLKECLGEDVLINEFVNYLSSDDLEEMIEGVEDCWDIPHY